MSAAKNSTGRLQRASGRGRNSPVHGAGDSRLPPDILPAIDRLVGILGGMSLGARRYSSRLSFTGRSASSSASRVHPPAVSATRPRHDAARLVLEAQRETSLAAAPRHLRARGLSTDRALIDGEAIVLRDDGRSDFGALMTKRLSDP